MALREWAWVGFGPAAGEFGGRQSEAKAAETSVILKRNGANPWVSEWRRLGVNRPGVCPAGKAEPGSLRVCAGS